MRARAFVALGACVACLVSLVPRTARAEKTRGAGIPMPEQILTESVTEIDAPEVGELEFVVNSAVVGARGGARTFISGLEAEYRLHEYVGLRAEIGYASARDSFPATARKEIDFEAAVAVSLIHDYARDFHLQLDVRGRPPDDEADPRVSATFAEAPLPFDATLQAGLRRGRFTFRAGAGAEAGGSYAYAPAHASLAILTGIDRTSQIAYFGVEAGADFVRTSPLFVAPNLVVDATPINLPFRLGLAVPIQVATGDAPPFRGAYLRLWLILDREAQGRH